MATSEQARSPAPGGFVALVVLLLAAVTAVAHVLGAGPLRESLWGSNLYAFLPRAALILSTLALAAAAWAALARPPARERMLASLSTATTAPAGRRALAIVLWMGVWGVLFWALRIRHAFLGDAGPLGDSLALGNRFHAHEPLTMVLHRQLYLATRDGFPGADAAAVARQTVALGSVLAGVLFSGLAILLARELSQVAESDEERAPHRVRTALLMLLMMAQGYIQLFFGYVENYTYVTLALGVYVLAALRVVRGAAPLWTAAAALALAVTLDLSAAVLAPSFIVPAACAQRRTGWTRWAIQLGVSLLLVLAAERGLALLGGGFDLAGEIVAMARLAVRGHGPGPADTSHWTSLGHLWNFANEHMLIGPLGLLALVPLAAHWLLARGRRAASRPPAGPAEFLLIAAACAAAASWATGDLNLGYPRDWDLFAPFGLVFTLASLSLLMARRWEPGGAERWLALALALSLYHTVPWIVVNASESRGLARLKTLPSGLGRTQVVVGRWYMTHGQPDEARAWFERAIRAEAGNSAAYYCLGLVDLDQGRYDDAGRSFWAALRLRPDKDDYRLRLVDALVRSGRPEWARPQLDTLLMHTPAEPRYLAALGIVHLGLGDRDAARTALERAVALAPGQSAYRDALARVDDPDGYQQTLWRDWHAAAGE